LSRDVWNENRLLVHEFFKAKAGNSLASRTPNSAAGQVWRADFPIVDEGHLPLDTFFFSNIGADPAMISKPVQTLGPLAHVRNALSALAGRSLYLLIGMLKKGF
jgi:hypothetical protein